MPACLPGGWGCVSLFLPLPQALKSTLWSEEGRGTLDLKGGKRRTTCALVPWNANALTPALETDDDPCRPPSCRGMATLARPPRMWEM